MDADRFTDLFQRHYDAVLRYARRRTTPDRASDVAADVFTVAWRRMDAVPVDALPWLIATARRVLANQRRTNERAAALQLRMSAEPAGLPSDLQEQVVVRMRWASALSRLSTDDQELLALFAWEGLSAKEAAASLGCSVAAVVMRLHRARRRLMVQVRDDSQPCLEPRPLSETDQKRAPL